MMKHYRFCASDVLRGQPNGPNVAKVSPKKGPHKSHDGPESAQERPKRAHGVYYSAPPLGYEQYRSEGAPKKECI